MSTPSSHRDPEPERLDELRRRLYRPDATDADVQHYVRERDADQAPDAPDTAPAPRRFRPAVPVVLLAAGATAALAVLVATAHPAATPSAARPSPTGPVVLQDVGDGQILAVRPRAASGPAIIATAVHGTPVFGQRFEGSGNAVVTIQPAGSGVGGGRAEVSLATAGDTAASWRVLRIVTRTDWTSYPVVMARGAASRTADRSADGTFSWAGAPPTRIAVRAPAGVRWALVYASTEGLEPTLH